MKNRNRFSVLEPLRILTAAFCVQAPFSHTALAQTSASSEANLFHWAYAASFGTGVYRIGDSEVFALHIPLSWQLRKSFVNESNEWRLGVKILFPITLSVQNFDFSGGIPDLFPDRIEQWSFTPGVEIEVPVNSRWTLRAKSLFGWGTELGGGDESAWIYGANLRSRFTFEPFKSGKLNLLNGFSWTGYTPNQGGDQSISRLMTGLELIYPAGLWKIGGQQVYLKPHLVNYLYFNDVEFPFSQENQFTTLDSEWEVGLAVGKKGNFKIWKVEFDRPE